MRRELVILALACAACGASPSGDRVKRWGGGPGARSNMIGNALLPMVGEELADIARECQPAAPAGATISLHASVSFDVEGRVRAVTLAQGPGRQGAPFGTELGADVGPLSPVVRCMQAKARELRLTAATPRERMTKLRLGGTVTLHPPAKGPTRRAVRARLMAAAEASCRRFVTSDWPLLFLVSWSGPGARQSGPYFHERDSDELLQCLHGVIEGDSMADFRADWPQGILTVPFFAREAWVTREAP